MKRLSFLILFTAISVLFVRAQKIERSILTSSGDYYSAGEYTMEWSIGEVITGSFESSGPILTQGFHQGRLLVSGKEDRINGTGGLNIYPNPVGSWLNLEWDNPQTSPDRVELFDVTGKNTHIEFLYGAPGEFQIDMTGHQPGIYLLRVVFGEHAFTYQLIKQ